MIEMMPFSVTFSIHSGSCISGSGVSSNSRSRPIFSEIWSGLTRAPFMNMRLFVTTTVGRMSHNSFSAVRSMTCTAPVPLQGDPDSFPWCVPHRGHQTREMWVLAPRCSRPKVCPWFHAICQEMVETWRGLLLLYLVEVQWDPPPASAHGQMAGYSAVLLEMAPHWNGLRRDSSTRYQTL